MKNSFKKSLLLLSTLLILIVNAIGATPVYAANTLMVNISNDSGAGSLRQALADAASGDTITFDGSLSGQTIRLASTLTLSKNVTIDGSSLASKITISGDANNSGTANAGDVRVFSVNGGVTATLDSLTISRGYEVFGAGIYNLGNLTVTNSILRDNSATRLGGGDGGSIYNRGNLTLTNSSLSNNLANGLGGGIFLNGGTQTVSDSTFSTNSATVGGAIFNYGGTSTVSNSTFSGNHAADSGGGIYNMAALTVTDSLFSGNSGSNGGAISSTGVLVITDSTFSGNSVTGDNGGAVYLESGMGTVTSSTFSGNSASYGGGLYNAETGTLNVANSTFSTNSAAVWGGGIFTWNTVTVTNSTFSDNSAVYGGGGVYRAGGTVTAKNNIIANSVSGGNCAGTINGSNNLADDATCGLGFANSASIRLGTLGNYGGATESYPLLAGSAALGAGDAATCAATPVSNKDQRGQSRPQGDVNCDLGAYESSLQSDTTPPDAPVLMAPPAVTNDPMPTIIGTAEANSWINVWYFDDFGDPIQICENVQADGSGNWTCASSKLLSEREIELAVNATDDAGNTSSPDTSYFFTIDITQPDAPVVISPSANAYTNDTTPAINGTAEADSRVNVWYLDDLGDPVPVCQDVLVDGSGNWSCVSSVTLPEHYIELAVNATDAAGNVSSNASLFFTVDLTALTVNSVIRSDPDQTKAASVDFTVTFSESVVGVNTSAPFDDFSLFTTGVTGASIAAVSGSGQTYTVTVNTGLGNGTIRLDVVDDDSIQDAAHNSLANGFTAGETYTIAKSNGLATLGVFRPSNGLLYLKNSNGTGFADVALNYGIPGDYPVVGDWDGNGTVTIGVYRNGKFYLRNSNTVGFADLVFAFGQLGDQPVAGDWDGDGLDTIGVYRPATGQFLLRNSNSGGTADMSFYLGNVGDVGIAGDWDGDGKDTTGVFRPINGIIFLKNTNETGYADVALNYGIPGDKPVTGDWDDDGIDTIGVYRNGQFLLRNSNTAGFADIVFGLGIPGDMPIAGNWDALP